MMARGHLIISSNSTKLEPLSEEPCQRPRQARDVPQQYVVRERERIHVLGEDRLACDKANRLHVHEAATRCRAVQREEREADARPRGDLPDGGLERLALVEAAVGEDDDELIQVLWRGTQAEGISDHRPRGLAI